MIGFMGSGKTTLGKKLASHLNWSFIDLDERVELKAGMKIPEIFAKKGEAYFRETESEVLKNLTTETDTVISTGGGAPCYGENMDYMLRSGITVYLKMTPGQLKSRLLRSSKGRPLLKNIPVGELEDYIKQKLSEREKCYSRAELVFKRFEAEISDLYLLVKKRIKE